MQQNMQLIVWYIMIVIKKRRDGLQALQSLNSQFQYFRRFKVISMQGSGPLQRLRHIHVHSESIWVQSQARATRECSRRTAHSKR